MWYDHLRELLCDLLRYWGGDCESLGETAPDWIETVAETYANQGVPTFAGPGEEAQFLAELDQLEAHLADPGNSLNEADHNTLTQFIASLRAAISSS